MNAEEDGFSVINAFLGFAELGAEWVMWLMIILGFIAIVLFFERLRLYLTTRVDAPSLARDLVRMLDARELDQARTRVHRGHAMEERVLADALEAWPRGSLVVEQIMMSSIAREKQRFDRFLTYFGTLGNNAPFIGLFGTVIGIILSFKALGENPKGGLEVVGPGIAEALVATAVGLLVAIPAVVMFNYFKGMLKARVGNTDFLGRILLARLKHEEESEA
jgi:biopolymer transport protein ExbB/TolQ